MIAIKDAQYIGSYPKEQLCPKDGKPEFAFIGRSNVGKSSLINMLTGRKALARISKKPGKTQLLNYFLIDKNWYLVDLPGYGYAVISQSKRKQWRKMIDDYMIRRRSLQCAFVLIDSNIPLQKIDLDFINFLGAHSVPFSLVFTKTDRQTKNKTNKNIASIKKALLQHWEELPTYFVTSSVDGSGREELLQFIEEVLEQ